MLTYQYTMPVDSISSVWMTESPENYLFFDIETTGLSAARSDLYIIGYGYILDNNRFQITLLFNEDGCSEPELLQAFANAANSFSTIVTYNGDTFDIPYITEKYRQFGLSSNLTSKSSLDIYRKMRKYKNILHMDSMKQSDLEAVLGLKRETFLSGKVLIQEYKDYLAAKDSILLDELLTHNKDDLFGLFYVSRALSVHTFFEGGFSIDTITKEEHAVCLRLSNLSLPVRLNFTYQDIVFSGVGEKMMVRIPFIQSVLKYFYKDYKNYYYLPVEQTAIHKDIACYMDASYREKARPDTAFTKKEGLFIKQNSFSMPYIFKKEYSDKDGYIELNQTFVEDKTVLKEYLLCVLAKAQK